jgi:hypothetical protein
MPATPRSEATGAVPPPGKTAAGNPNSFAVPTCMNRKAAMILRMDSRYGDHDRQRDKRPESFTGASTYYGESYLRD